MSARPTFTDAARRRRLVARHHLRRSAPDVETAVADLVALHSSDPVTPHLALWARVPGYAPDDLDRALADDRAVTRLHAMRRTLFVVHRDDTPAVLAGATADIAAKERRRVEGWLADEVGDAGGWLVRQAEAVRAALAEGGEQTTRDLMEAVPALKTEVTLGSGKWSQRSPVGSRLLYLMAMDGDIVRTRPAGTWKSSQYAWAPGDFEARPDAEAARAAVLRRYLATHGPATETDLRWWSGWTAKQTRAARAALQTVEVALDGGEKGVVLEGDLDDVEAAPAAALLPGLDSTPMGWKQRGWFLGGHEAALFDRNGNAGPTVWWDGRVVGGWGQRDDGEVVHRLLEDIGAEGEAAVVAEVERLAAWLGEVTVTPRFRTPLEKALVG